MKTIGGIKNSKTCHVDGCERASARCYVEGKPVCNKHYLRHREHKQFELPPRKKTEYETCIADGCQREATRVSHRLCEMHHARKRRSGGVELTPLTDGKPIEHTAGYVLIYAPDHPLRVGNSPRVYEHRIVYYTEHGEGPFACYHCGASVDWSFMHVDHLDDDVKNNATDNLVASCPGCNQARGRWKMAKTARRGGRLYSYGGRTMCSSEWAELLGISRPAFMYRMKNWDTERAFNEPRGRFGPPQKPQGVH